MTFLKVAQYIGTALIIVAGSAAFLGIIMHMFSDPPPPDVKIDDDNDTPMFI